MLEAADAEALQEEAEELLGEQEVDQEAGAVPEVVAAEDHQEAEEEAVAVAGVALEAASVLEPRSLFSHTTDLRVFTSLEERTMPL